jgi:hypothetical protein
MKLRIKGNTIRFRLTKSEVAYFSEKKFIQESTNLGKRIFSYGMKASDAIDKIGAEYENDGITITIPTALAKSWTDTNLVGLSEEMPVQEGKKLFILIEKDFKCLDEVSEDQSDNYPNPLADKLK